MTCSETYSPALSSLAKNFCSIEENGQKFQCITMKNCDLSQLIVQTFMLIFCYVYSIYYSYEENRIENLY